MNENVEIELLESSSEQKTDVQLPMNFLSFGEIDHDDVKVYIKQDVYQALEKYALADVKNERGTILLGEYSENLGKMHVIISAYIEARYTDASASTLTFTHETWDYVHKQHDLKHPDKRIVGWQHTHPNYGIFLSNYDLFIQNNFFNMPFQVAYVIDPIQNIRGFFQWKNGKIEKLNGFYVYDDVGKPIKIEQKRAKKVMKEETREVEVPRKTNKVLNSIVALLCIATVVLSASLFFVNEKYRAQFQRQEEILKEIEAQNSLIGEQALKTGELQEQLGNDNSENDETTTAADLLKKIENQEVTLQNQEEALNELKVLIEKGSDNDSNVAFKAHKVVAGDTLLKICNENGVDYYANSNIIFAINGIEDANQIRVGQTILLPVLD